MISLLLAGACALAAPTSTVYVDRLAPHSVPIREVVKLYGLTAEGEALLRALARYENGGEGNLCGHDNPRSHRQPYGSACLNDDAIATARGWLAISEFMQDFLLKNADRRREFLIAYAKWYHSCGNNVGFTEEECAKVNMGYASELAALYRQERAFVYDRQKHGGWKMPENTVTPTGHGSAD